MMYLLFFHSVSVCVDVVKIRGKIPQYTCPKMGITLTLPGKSKHKSVLIRNFWVTMPLSPTRFVRTKFRGSFVITKPLALGTSLYACNHVK